MYDRNDKYKDRPEKQMKNPWMWMQILKNSLCLDPAVRWSSKDLQEYMKKNKNAMIMKL